MEIGIGLPAHIPGVTGRALVEWAQRADALGFSSLGSIDRIVFPNYEPLIALAAAAAVTERARLLTNILIAPLRPNAALLAKQAATVDSISNGRLVFGLAVGGRRDDFSASGLDFRRRGRVFDHQLEEMRRVWNGEAGIGPPLVRPGGPEVIIGGFSPAAIRRVPRYAGWISGGGGVERFKQGAEAAKAAWKQAGKPGAPRLLALSYFSLGEEATPAARRYLLDYYSFLGPAAEAVARGALTTPKIVKEEVTAFEGAGCDELVLLPCATGIEQVDLLAEATL